MIRTNWLMKKFVMFFMAVMILACSISLACSVPVFRYALERWQADPYTAQVEYSGELTGEAKDALQMLEGYSTGKGQTICNLDFKSTQVEGLLKPRITLQFPTASRIGSNLFSGDLSLANVSAIVDSPTRKEISKRLTTGESAVWVFLESGHADKDSAALKVLKETLVKLENELELPEDDLAGLESTDYDPSLVIAEENEHAVKIDFSVLPVSRKDQAEKFLVDSLLATERDLLEFDEPMAFPVFGRGRILYALVGKGIGEGNIAKACRFLTGPCSCQVKALNPGVDMLLSVDWDSELEGTTLIEEIELPELSGLTTVDKVVEKTAAPDDVEAAIIEDEANAGDASLGVFRNLLIVVAGIIGVIGLVSIVLRKSSSN
jgi:hypothetical protein